MESDDLSKITQEIIQKMKQNPEYDNSICKDYLKKLRELIQKKQQEIDQKKQQIQNYEDIRKKLTKEMEEIFRKYLNDVEKREKIHLESNNVSKIVFDTIKNIKQDQEFDNNKREIDIKILETMVKIQQKLSLIMEIEQEMIQKKQLEQEIIQICCKNL